MRHGSKIFAVFLFVGVAFVLLTNLVDVPMQLSRSASGFVLALTLGTTATAKNLTDEIDAQWRKPANFWDTDLRATIDVTGTFGFIFNSSSLPKGVRYGSYNYCNMPHVRKPEYKRPSGEFTLEYVEVVHRHHKRTAYRANLASGP